MLSSSPCLIHIGIKIAVRSDKKKRRRDSVERESQIGGIDAPVDPADEEED